VRVQVLDLQVQVLKGPGQAVLVAKEVVHHVLAVIIYQVSVQTVITIYPQRALKVLYL
jgi:hypothetical protein